MLYIPNDTRAYKQTAIQTVPAAEILHLPLHTYSGDMQVLVKAGQQVLKYQQVAASAGPFATAVHAPVSGTIKGIIRLADRNYLSLINDFKAEEINVMQLRPLELENQQLLNYIQQHGIEGSGGARFPTALKYEVERYTIQTLIINATECEPFLTADYATLYHESTALFQAISLVKKILKAHQVVIALEKQNSDLVPQLQKLIGERAENIQLKVLGDTYPQGGELQLIHSITGKKLKKGSIPAQAGIIVSNIGTIRALFTALFEGKPYTARIVTLYDDFQKKGANFQIPIGTPIAHIIKHSFLQDSPPQKGQYILGGPMMGKPVVDLQIPIHKGAGGLIHIPIAKTSSNNCISCGYCADVCPQHLLPMEFARHVFNAEPAKLATYHLQDCIECGACAYICPSQVPLMWSIHTGKQQIAKN